MFGERLIGRDSWTFGVTAGELSDTVAARIDHHEQRLAFWVGERDAAEAVQLVADDAHIEIGSIKRIRVAHKAEQRVVIRFELGNA